MPVPAIIGLIGSVLGTVVSNALQQQGINDMNRYNSPGAMASRLQQAGFSPANVFSQGAPAGVQSLIGNYQNSIGSDAMAAVSASQQGELIKSQKQALESEAALKNAQTIQQILESDIFKKYADKEKQYQLANYVADLALKEANTGLVRAQTVTESHMPAKIDSEVALNLSKLGVNQATIRNLNAATDNLIYDLEHVKPAQVDELRKKIDLYSKQMDEIDSKIGLNDAMRDRLRHLTELEGDLMIAQRDYYWAMEAKNYKDMDVAQKQIEKYEKDINLVSHQIQTEFERTRLTNEQRRWIKWRKNRIFKTAIDPGSSGSGY